MLLMESFHVSDLRYSVCACVCVCVCVCVQIRLMMVLFQTIRYVNTNKYYVTSWKNTAKLASQIAAILAHRKGGYAVLEKSDLGKKDISMTWGICGNSN